MSLWVIGLPFLSLLFILFQNLDIVFNLGSKRNWHTGLELFFRSTITWASCLGTIITLKVHHIWLSWRSHLVKANRLIPKYIELSIVDSLMQNVYFVIEISLQHIFLLINEVDNELLQIFKFWVVQLLHCKFKLLSMVHQFL